MPKNYYLHDVWLNTGNEITNNYPVSKDSTCFHQKTIVHHTRWNTIQWTWRNVKVDKSYPGLPGCMDQRTCWRTNKYQKLVFGPLFVSSDSYLRTASWRILDASFPPALCFMRCTMKQRFSTMCSCGYQCASLGACVHWPSYWAWKAGRQNNSMLWSK